MTTPQILTVIPEWSYAIHRAFLYSVMYTGYILLISVPQTNSKDGEKSKNIMSLLAIAKLLHTKIYF